MYDIARQVQCITVVNKYNVQSIIILDCTSRCFELVYECK